MAPPKAVLCRKGKGQPVTPPPPPGLGRAAQQCCQGQRKKDGRGEGTLPLQLYPSWAFQVPWDPTHFPSCVSRNQALGECLQPQNGPTIPGDTVPQNPSWEPPHLHPGQWAPPSVSPPPRPPPTVALSSGHALLLQSGDPLHPLRVQRDHAACRARSPRAALDGRSPANLGAAPTRRLGLRSQPTAFQESLQAEATPTPRAAGSSC